MSHLPSDAQGRCVRRSSQAAPGRGPKANGWGSPSPRSGVDSVCGLLARGACVRGTGNAGTLVMHETCVATMLVCGGAAYHDARPGTSWQRCCQYERVLPFTQLPHPAACGTHRRSIWANSRWLEANKCSGLNPNPQGGQSPEIRVTGEKLPGGCRLASPIPSRAAQITNYPRRGFAACSCWAAAGHRSQCVFPYGGGRAAQPHKQRHEFTTRPAHLTAAPSSCHGRIQPAGAQKHSKSRPLSCRRPSRAS